MFGSTFVDGVFVVDRRGYDHRGCGHHMDRNLYSAMSSQTDRCIERLVHLSTMQEPQIAYQGAFAVVVLAVMAAIKASAFWIQRTMRRETQPLLVRHQTVL
jgi:hypothetical protein